MRILLATSIPAFPCAEASMMHQKQGTKSRAGGNERFRAAASTLLGGHMWERLLYTELGVPALHLSQFLPMVPWTALVGCWRSPVGLQGGKAALMDRTEAHCAAAAVQKS